MHSVGRRDHAIDVHEYSLLFLVHDILLTSYTGSNQPISFSLFLMHEI